MTYDFQTQLNKGLIAEEKLKRQLQVFFDVVTANYEDETGKKLQQQGIDLLVRDKKSWHSFQVKQDNRVIETHKYYLELENNCRKGWIYSTQADYLVISLADTGVYALTRPLILRQNITKWTNSFRKITCNHNGNNYSQGLLLPVLFLPAIYINHQELENLFYLIERRKEVFNHQTLTNLKTTVSF